MESKPTPQELRDGEMQGRLNGAIAFAVIGFAIFVSPLKDILFNTITITLLLYLVVGGFTVYHRVQNRNLRVGEGDAVEFLIALIALPILGLLFYSSWVLLKTIYIWQMAGPQSVIFQPIFGSIITLIAGVALFKFRAIARGFYGLTEVVAGVSIAAYRISTGNTDILNASPEIYIALLTAGVYLVVRGLDNMEQGRFRFGLGAFGIRLAKE